MSTSNYIAFFFLLLGACHTPDKKKEAEEQNKKTIEAYVDTVWNKKELDSLGVYFAGKFIRKVNNIDLAVNIAEYAANILILFESFPDLQMDIEDIATTANKVFMNWTVTGTNTGKFSDHPPTGQRVKVSGITRIDLNEEGKIIYENIYYNELSLMQQLGYKLSLPTTE